MNKLLVASTEDSAYFGDLIANQMGAERLAIEHRTFGDGEEYLRLGVGSDVELRGKDIIFVGATHTDKNLLELFRAGWALAKYGAQRRVFVIPFLGYSTMERATRPGEVITAKANARMLSAIPNTLLDNTFFFMDLHVQDLLNYFEGECMCIELHAESVVLRAIEELGLENMIFASADMGRAKRIQSFADKFRADMALVEKERIDGTSRIKAVIGNVRGKNVVIYDDMTRSGKSALNAAEVYMDNGARDVYLALSHLALNDTRVALALGDSCLRKIVATNTHPMSQWPMLYESYSKFEILDVSPIFTQALKEIFRTG